jgi:hypothetical protein
LIEISNCIQVDVDQSASCTGQPFPIRYYNLLSHRARPRFDRGEVDRGLKAQRNPGDEAVREQHISSEKNLQKSITHLGVICQAAWGRGDLLLLCFEVERGDRALAAAAKRNTYLAALATLVCFGPPQAEDHALPDMLDVPHVESHQF